jgi:glycosyltransferase involved in cell wall biosynthesis
VRICLCDAQVPFAYGGAEMLIESLRDELARRGHQVDVVRIPFHWPTRVDILKAALAWRLTDLTAAESVRIDRVICTRFPSYLIKHPDKVVWLVHQLRQVYDLLGTRHSDFAPQQPRDARAIAMIKTMDSRTLREARAVYTISENTAQRLRQFNGIAAEALHPPPRLGPVLHPGPTGDYVLGVGRLNRLKRFDLLIRAIAAAPPPVRCRIAGTGPEHEALAELAQRLGVADRVELLGWVDDAALVELYAGALAVFFAPYDEDYGYVTIEAFKAGKPVLTTADAGGVLEFVRHDENGIVSASDSPAQLAAAIGGLALDPGRAQALGAAGAKAVDAIHWDHVIERLTA